MGIQGLLPLLKSIQKPVSIGADFRGQVLGVDVYCWLHKGAYGCAMELVEGKTSNVYVNYVLKRVEMLLHFDVKPILVFDGSYLPSKAGQEAQRRKTRQDNKAKGLAFLRAGNRQQALESFQKCVDITPDMALEVIKECRKKGLDYIVAPYEADAQLAYLMKSGITQATISEDSDLLVYGCQKVIFKMDACGHGIAVDLSDLSKLTNLKLHEFTHEKFRHMCILSGCDYLPSVKGVGLHKAIKLLRKSSCVYKLIRSLRLDGKMHVPPDYEKNFKQADETFLYQLVFDPVTSSLVPLNQFPEGIKLGDLDFAGPLMSGEKALGIALGNINPISGEVMANFNPKSSPVFTNDVVGEVSTDDNCRARALTPNSLSSWGYPVMSKRRKTEYDVQKNLCGLMFDSQPSAKSRRAFVPPGQRRKINEDTLDDDSLATMYTSLKPRPTLIQRNAKAVPGRAKRSRFKNPFRIGDQETESLGEASRYFNLVRSPESPSKLSSSGTVQSSERFPDEQLDIGEGQGAIMKGIQETEDVVGFTREGVLDPGLTDSKTGNSDQNKENEPRKCDHVVEKVEYLSNTPDEARESYSRTSHTMVQSSGEGAKSHGVLANHATINTDDTKQRNQPYINLCDRFGYKPSFKSPRESMKPNESEAKDIDSGCLSDAANSTDGDTPHSTPSPPCFTRLTPPYSDENVARLLNRGSAAGTKTMKNQIQLKSKTGVRSTGLGRCRAMGITRKKLKQTSSKESSNSSGSSTLFSYFEFERRKRPRLEEDQSVNSKLS